MRRPRWLKRRPAQPETWAERQARIEAAGEAGVREMLAAEPDLASYVPDHLLAPIREAAKGEM
jgi:hypothetical protein